MFCRDIFYDHWPRFRSSYAMKAFKESVSILFCSLSSYQITKCQQVRGMFNLVLCKSVSVSNTRPFQPTYRSSVKNIRAKIQEIIPYVLLFINLLFKAGTHFQGNQSHYLFKSWLNVYVTSKNGRMILCFYYFLVTEILNASQGLKSQWIFPFAAEV